MEISKALQEEIVSVQNKLKNAIRDHQIYVGQLKNDPNNTDIVDGIRKIQLHIIALGRWQKQVVQRLRKEVESYKADNALNGARISVASLLGLNNNNHITHNNESATTRRHSAEAPEESKPLLNGHADSRSSSKEDYEETVRNGDVASPLRDDVSVKDRRSSSVEPAPVDDESMAGKPEENGEDEKPKLTAREQQYFLGCLGLITNARLIELQNKRAERKRRSTANSHFVYNNWEVPMKRKRHAYLQSLGSAPQTRQTTARLNGPSPPPKPYNKPGPKPGAAAAARSLIQASNKPGPKPAILRNGDGKPKDFFGGKIVKQETEKNSGSSSSSSSNGRDSEQRKSAQQTTSTGKAVHIPGLPSSLTIERIENDSSVCVTCRNPGTLTVCEYCSAKFHISCHTTSPGSTCYCPKCAARFRSKNISASDLEILLEKSMKKDKETAAAAYASRAIGKTGEDTEVHKAPGGLYQADAAQPGRQLLTAAALGINQLPSSTFLIPIAATSSASNDSGGIVSVATVDQSLILSSSSSLLGSATSAARLGFAIEQQKQTSILLNQLSQPSLTSANGNSESRILRQAQDIVAGQSLLLVDKVARQRPVKRPVRQRRWRTNKPVRDYNEWSNISSTDAESKPKSGLPVTKSSNYVTVEVICQDDDEDRSRVRNENSSDYVYIELESPRPKSIDQQEPEVHNDSSESCGVQGIDESDRSAAIEHLETVSKSPCSPESASTCDRDQQPQQQEGSTFDDSSANNSTASCQNDDDDDDNFLSTIFPGRYGYKIDVIDIDTPISEFDESFESSSTEPEVPSQPESQNEQLEHVKLEEAHLSAPLGTELVKETIIDEPLTEETMDEETSVEETTVDETPVGEAEVEDTLVEETEIEDALVEETEVEDTPVEETEIEDALVEETEVEDTPVEETEVEDTPFEQTEVEETTFEEAQVEDTAIEETAEDTPVEEMQVDEASVEDAPVEDAQFEDTPIEEAMVVETPVEENSEHSEESQQLTTVPDNKSDEADEVREQSDEVPDSESGEHYSGDNVSSDETIVDAMTATIAMMAD